MIKFCLAKSTEEYDAARDLFAEYGASLEIDLDFQKFEEELQVLRTMYSPPYGGIILAQEDDRFIGCVGIRKINETTGELKRMYVRPDCQNRGLGKALLEKALVLAKECNYKAVRLDTLNGMLPAISLYEKAGFKKIEAYYFNPNPDALYFEKSFY